MRSTSKDTIHLLLGGISVFAILAGVVLAFGIGSGPYYGGWFPEEQLPWYEAILRRKILGAVILAIGLAGAILVAVANQRLERSRTPREEDPDS